MHIPQDRSTYIPDLPLEAIRNILLIIGVCVLLYSFPVTGNFDQVEPTTQSTTVPLQYTNDDGEREVDIFEVRTSTVTTGASVGGSIRIRTQAGWQNPYTNTDRPPEAPLEITVIIAPGSWHPDRAARDGTVLISNTSMYAQGDYKTFEWTTTIPNSFSPTGIGPAKATVYYYLESNDGTAQFEPLRTYAIYRPFWNRPRAWLLFASMFLIGVTIPTFSQSVRSQLSAPINQYADRKWQEDLVSTTNTLDTRFQELAPSSPNKLTITEEIQAASRDKLQDHAHTLNQFRRLYEAVSQKSLSDTVSDTAPLHTAAAETYWSVDIQTANQITDLVSGLARGTYVETRGDTYEMPMLVEESLAAISTGDNQQLATAVDRLSRFNDAKETVEQWSQPVSGDRGEPRTRLTVEIDGEWIEPTELWESVERSLSTESLDEFISQAESIKEMETLTAPLRKGSSKKHPLAEGRVPESIIDAAREAVQSADLTTLDDQLTKSEAWFAKQELEKLLDSTDLSHSPVNPADIRDRVEHAWTNGEYDRVQLIQVEVLNQLDTTWRPTDLLDLSPTQFEQILGQLYRRRGFDVMVTRQSADRGIDVIAKDSQRRIAIQAKRYDPSGAGSVSGPEVRAAIGATVQEGADSCVVATSSGFTDDAVQAARETNRIDVQLFSGRVVAQMLSEAQVPKP